MQLTLNI